MLPKRIPKATKRATRWRSPAHCNFVTSHECCVDGCDGRPIEAAHVRLGSHTGMGQKPDDWRVVGLCRHHHSYQHEIGEKTFWDAIGQKDPEALIAEFIKASPKRREIEQIMRERETCPTR